MHTGGYMKTLKELEKVNILQRFIDLDGSRTKTAKSLSITLRTLQRRLVEYKISKGVPGDHDVCEQSLDDARMVLYEGKVL